MLAKVYHRLQLGHWSWFRIVQLGMGLLFGIAGWEGHEPMVTIMGGALILSALLGIGCSANCAAAPQSKK
jgi:hypothetical protein